MNQYIPGARPGNERQSPRLYSLQSMMLSPEEGDSLRDLHKAVKERGANCESDPEAWSGDTLPTDREAQMMCSGCPVLEKCRDYAKSHDPAWGVWGGSAFGRDIEAIEKEEQNEQA